MNAFIHALIFLLAFGTFVGLLFAGLPLGAIFSLFIFGGIYVLIDNSKAKK